MSIICPNCKRSFPVKGRLNFDRQNYGYTETMHCFDCNAIFDATTVIIHKHYSIEYYLMISKTLSGFNISIKEQELHLYKTEDIIQYVEFEDRGKISCQNCNSENTKAWLKNKDTCPNCGFVMALQEKY